MTHGDATLHVLNNAEHSCSLDVAAEGPLSVDEIGRILNLTGQAVRNVLEDALTKLAAADALLDADTSMPHLDYSKKPRNAEDETADILGIQESASWMTSALCHWTKPNDLL